MKTKVWFAVAESTVELGRPAFRAGSHRVSTVGIMGQEALGIVVDAVALRNGDLLAQVEVDEGWLTFERNRAGEIAARIRLRRLRRTQGSTNGEERKPEPN